MSGLASLPAKVTGDQYCAGIWLNDFTRSLLWTRLAPRRPDNGSLDLKIAEPYRAPSFSWASVDGSLIWSPYCDRKDFENLALLKDYQCNVIGDNSFGRVLSGHLRLEAPISLITEIHQSRWDGALRINIRGIEYIGHGGLDQADNDIPADGKLEGRKAGGCTYVLGLAFTGIFEIAGFSVVGLIVRRTCHKDSEFIRVGHYHMSTIPRIDHYPECQGIGYKSPEYKEFVFKLYGLNERTAISLI